MSLCIVPYRAARFTPAKMTSGAAASDLRSTISAVIWPGCVRLIPTGLRLALPEGRAALVLPRSGQALKRRLVPANSPGLIDCDYRGEIFVALENRGWVPRIVEEGERIAQIMVISIENVQWQHAAIPSTERGEGGFGSTGRGLDE